MTSSPNDVINDQKAIFGRFIRIFRVTQARNVVWTQPKGLWKYLAYDWLLLMWWRHYLMTSSTKNAILGRFNRIFRAIQVKYIVLTQPKDFWSYLANVWSFWCDNVVTWWHQRKKTFFLCHSVFHLIWSYILYRYWKMAHTILHIYCKSLKFYV